MVTFGSEFYFVKYHKNKIITVRSTLDYGRPGAELYRSGFVVVTFAIANLPLII